MGLTGVVCQFARFERPVVAVGLKILFKAEGKVEMNGKAQPMFQTVAIVGHKASQAIGQPSMVAFSVGHAHHHAFLARALRSFRTVILLEMATHFAMIAVLTKKCIVGPGAGGLDELLEAFHLNLCLLVIAQVHVGVDTSHKESSSGYIAQSGGDEVG